MLLPRKRGIIVSLIQLQCHLMTCVVVSSLSPTSPTPLISSSNRRDFIAKAAGGSAAVATHLSAPFQALADDDNPAGNTDQIASLLNAKTIDWSGPSWSSCRYSASTLSSSSSNNNNHQDNAPPAGRPAIYPSWLEGHHAIKYKFEGASFPQGRRILSLRTAGAGLGTCLSLPNVGYSPPASHAVHFVSDGGGGTYEDLAYNIPRKFESFWPQSKVLAIQTNGRSSSSSSSTSNLLSPMCRVTGEGCDPNDNPNLHLPSSRVNIDFEGPTRQGGRLIQSSDVTMLDCSSSPQTNFNANGQERCTISKTYSQYNLNQELQTFYREISSYESKGNDDIIMGKIRVAAFLPMYIRDMDSTSSNSGSASSNNRLEAGSDYDEKEAVAIYDYKFFMKDVDETEAASI